MKLSDPSIQDRVHGTVDNAAAAAIAAAEPLLTAPNTILWLVFAGALLIFLLIIYLIMRSRVVSAQRYAEAADAKFFQPAGDEAEITFEGENAGGKHDAHRAKSEYREAGEDVAEVVIERPGEDAEPAFVGEDDDTDRARAKRGVISGFFSRIKKRDDDEDDRHNPDEVPIEANGLLDEEEEFEIDRSDPFAKMRGSLDFEADETPVPARAASFEAEREALALKRRAEEEADAIRRRAEDDARRLQLEAEESARRRRAEEDARREAEREAEFERRKLALASEREMRPEPSQIDFERALSRELDDRFAALQERLERQAGDRPPVGAAPLGGPAFAGAGTAPGPGGLDAIDLDAIDKRLAEHRELVDKSLSAMALRLDQVAASPHEMQALRSEIAELRGALRGSARSAPTAPTVQLGDIVRNALSPDAYELNAILPNNRKADCLVRLPKPPGPVAIDARFPVEAYAKLQRALAVNDNDQHAENEFRRVVLRHVVDIAERLILPEETAESALMFLPSESIYTELHSRFPDVVQDSYRARVWIVSPTTLMATLHTIRAIVRDAHVRENATFIQSEAEHVLDEVDSLRRRVYSLEENFDRTRSDVREVISSTDQVYRRAETITRGALPLGEGRYDRPAGARIPAPAEPGGSASGAPAPPLASQPAAAGVAEGARPVAPRPVQSRPAGAVSGAPEAHGPEAYGPEAYGPGGSGPGRSGDGSKRWKDASLYAGAPQEPKPRPFFTGQPGEPHEAGVATHAPDRDRDADLVEAEEASPGAGDAPVFPLR